MDNSRAWYIYHGSLGANYRGSFDAAAFTSDTGYFGSGMTDTLVTLKSGGSGGNNYNGADMIYYVWADVPGLQKFGRFTGNGSADGPFVELGFRPSIVWIRRTDSGQNWAVHDAERDKFNECDKNLAFNLASQENNSGDIGTGDANEMDFLSNGFKLRDSAAVQNASNGTYIYCAWAEAPTINLYGGSSNAR